MLPGLFCSAVIALLAFALSGSAWAQQHGISPLVIAIVLGMLFGNTVYTATGRSLHAGLAFSQKVLLRIGVALFGLNIGFDQIAALGWSAVWLDGMVIVAVMLIGTWIGCRWFRLELDMALLTAIGSAICGAAAVLAAAPILRADNQKVAMAVATVVLFGTVAMFAYPLVYPWLGMDSHAYGIYLGSTVHEVAQVVAAGAAVSQSAAETGVIVKLIRVMMLAPTLIILSIWLNRRSAADQRTPLYVPWFVIAFIVISALNTWLPIPEPVHARLVQADLFLLAMAMGALGVDTHFGRLKTLGLKPLGLATVLFGLLFGGGLLLNKVWI